MKAEAVIASAFVIICANFIVYVIIRFWRFYRILRHLHQEAYRTQ